MTTLALEFSSAERSVALARDGTIVAEAAESGGYRVTNAFGLIENVLATANISRDDIDLLAIGLGPGSYTGIRVAIAVAQGWQLARGVKILGVCSAEVLAAQAQAAKMFGRVNVVIDAQRGEYYRANWDISATQRQEISPLKIVAATELKTLTAAGEICVGPDAVAKMFPAAATVLQLAFGRMEFLAGELLAPIYLRDTNFVKAPPARVL